MFITEVGTAAKFSIEIVPVEDQDFKFLNKKRYFFNWKLELGRNIHKLTISGSNDIKGLISFEYIPDEWRIHIRLLTVSRENSGKEKIYERIVGNLIAFVAKQAIKEYGELACVSLIPKSEIAQHYINKYNFNLTGRTLSIELPEILQLLKEYDND